MMAIYQIQNTTNDIGLRRMQGELMIELNKCYNMDNLKLLNQIPNSYIDLIYCDILYGTGKKFKDYTDLKPVKQVIDDFYIPRIQEMFGIFNT